MSASLCYDKCASIKLCVVDYNVSFFCRRWFNIHSINLARCLERKKDSKDKWTARLRVMRAVSEIAPLIIIALAASFCVVFIKKAQQAVVFDWVIFRWLMSITLHDWNLLSCICFSKHPLAIFPAWSEDELRAHLWNTTYEIWVKLPEKKREMRKDFPGWGMQQSKSTEVICWVGEWDEWSEGALGLCKNSSLMFLRAQQNRSPSGQIAFSKHLIRLPLCLKPFWMLWT